MTLEQQVDNLTKMVEALTKQTKRVRISWQDSVSGSGIQIHGPSTITREGELLGVTTLPTEQGFAGLWTVKQDDGTIKLVQGNIKVVE